ncbi:MAG: hypothetical protein ACHQPI_10835 [Thermoanaerobaculia bacterium]
MIKARILTRTALAAMLVAACSIQADEVVKVVDPLCTDPNLTCSKCVYIDIFDAAHTTGAPAGSPWILPNINGGKGVSVGTLISGKTYLVTVTGWVSYWFRSLWDAYGAVGLPIQPPKYYSDGPGAPLPADQTMTGYDWQCLFAYPATGGVHPVPSSYSSNRVSLDGGVTYGDLSALGGLVCSPDHTYRYLIVGKGLPAYFRISDTGPTYDNYGKYKICVQLVCCGETGCTDLAPEQSVTPSSTMEGVFDPRTISGYSDR